MVILFSWEPWFVSNISSTTLTYIQYPHSQQMWVYIYVLVSVMYISVWSLCTISAVALLYVVAVVTTAVCALSHLVLASPHAQCQVYMTNHISKTNREGISELFLCFSWRGLLHSTFSKMTPGQLTFQAVGHQDCICCWETDKQDHLRMNVAPDLNNHLWSIDLFRSMIIKNRLRICDSHWIGIE